MAYVLIDILDSKVELSKAVINLRHKIIVDSINCLQNEQVSTAERIHNARKSIKKLRALLRLIRPALPNSLFKSRNSAYRNIAKELADVREAEALLESCHRLIKRYSSKKYSPALQLLKAELTVRESGCSNNRVSTELLTSSIDEATKAIVVAARNLTKEARQEFVPTKLEARAIINSVAHSFVQASLAFDICRKNASEQNMHDWRKRVKNLGYQLELINISSKYFTKQRKRLKLLAGHLGDFHDLCVLLQWLSTNKDRFSPNQQKQIQQLVTKDKRRLFTSAKRVGKKVFKSSEKHFKQKLRVLSRLQCR